MSSEIAIKVNHVGKTFHESQGAGSFKEAFVNIGRKLTGRKEKILQKGDHIALQGIDFEIKKGEFFGIVGRNGSGKSTLLKIIAGVYTPTSGSVSINGSLTPFIELGVGFNPELSGRDNVFLNGALLGFTRKQMEEMYDDIVEFAELKDFMDVKLKNYSSGMQVRLAFSVAIRAESDILLIDEVLAVGDSAFQKKCFEYFVHLKQSSRTVCFVTHDMSSVERFCDKVLVIDKSVSKGVLKPEDASSLYQFINAESFSKTTQSSDQNEKKWDDSKVSIKSVIINKVNTRKKKKVSVKQGDNLLIKLKLNSSIGQSNVVVGLSFVDEYGVNISGPNSFGHNFTTEEEISFKIENVPFTAGSYRLVVAVFDEDLITEHYHNESEAEIVVLADGINQYGKINLFGKWSNR